MSWYSFGIILPTIVHNAPNKIYFSITINNSKCDTNIPHLKTIQFNWQNSNEKYSDPEYFDASIVFSHISFSHQQNKAKYSDDDYFASSIIFLDCIPHRKTCFWCVVFVAIFPFSSWNIIPRFISNIILQNTDYVIINHKTVKLRIGIDGKTSMELGVNIIG